MESALDTIDEKIKPYVMTLRQAGIETIESCQGGDGHSSPEPFIRFAGDYAEGYKAFAVALNYDFPLLKLCLTYDVDRQTLKGPYWDMVFKPFS